MMEPEQLERLRKFHDALKDLEGIPIPFNIIKQHIIPIQQWLESYFPEGGPGNPDEVGGGETPYPLGQKSSAPGPETSPPTGSGLSMMSQYRAKQLRKKRLVYNLKPTKEEALEYIEKHGVKRVNQEVPDARFDTTLTLEKDGDQWCALLGKNLQEGKAGFGDTRSNALRALAEELENEG